MVKKLLDDIQAKYNGFTKSFKKIADYVIHNQSVIAFISINDLALTTGTSPATITRFTRELGYAKYPKFQNVFQQELAGHSSHMKDIKTELEDMKQSPNKLQKIIDTNIELLNDIDVGTTNIAINQAVNLIDNSRKIYVLGARGSYPLAYYFYFMLKEFREGAELMLSGATDFTDKLMYIDHNDVLFTISCYPYTNFTCQVASYFRDNGNKIISLLDKEDSTIGNLSDVVISTGNGHKAHSSIPFIAILNGILVELASRDDGEAIKRLDRLKDITDRFDIYIDK